jgi:hypothetical protein
MSDFETHPIGTTTEIKLSRQLAAAIEQELQQYGNVIPHSVHVAYNRLYEFYLKQMEMEHK